MGKRIWKMLRRVFPRCSMVSQAIAFNVFLAFFPLLLLVVGFASTWIGSKTAILDAIRNFTDFLPPGSQAVVTDFLDRREPDVWKYALAGVTGALFGGTQVMKLLMEGIHLIYGDEERIGFVHRQLRGLLLLLITMAPIVVAGILGVFRTAIAALADQRVVAGTHRCMACGWYFFRWPQWCWLCWR